MLARQRQRVILSMLETQPSLRTIELAKHFDVTDETIRRDLEFLDAENKLIRTHGGALRIEKNEVNLPMQKRLQEKREQKQQIAQKALKYIKEGQTIFLDASSTVLALAEALPDIDITVITNGHDCIVPIMEKPKINLIVTGGKLDRFSHSYGGFMTWQVIKKFSVDKAFFSCNGVDIERGASEVAEFHAEFKENVLPLCSERILLCDASKLGVRSTRFFAGFDVIDRIITDDAAEKTFLEKLNAIGISAE
ncbi:MAG: DeoR/GlpR transcriptional regulator [Verrucomicrobiaceae bacterium]|nr:DeoR/GlpR transcriptional regulator [Verrucomicrobiaceae bacterium]